MNTDTQQFDRHLFIRNDGYVDGYGVRKDKYVLHDAYPFEVFFTELTGRGAQRRQVTLCRFKTRDHAILAHMIVTFADDSRVYRVRKTTRVGPRLVKHTEFHPPKSDNAVETRRSLDHDPDRDTKLSLAVEALKRAGVYWRE